MTRYSMGLVALLAPVWAATAQGTVDTAMARRVVEAVATAAQERYVVRDTGRMIADYLRERLAKGTYAQPLDIGRFTDRLTADMQATNHDLHLYVMPPGAAGGPPGAQVVSRGGGDDPMLAADRRVNHNFDAVQRLAGNVGYIAISQLTGRTQEAYRTLDAGLAFLAYTDALIIDLRSTRGGTAPMSDYLLGYFLGPEARTLNSFVASRNLTMERVTPVVQGTLRKTIPVILLVGPGTASGGEDFAFAMRKAKRATLVGEKTAGAGRPTSFYPASDGFVVSVPAGRTWDPETGGEWERVGIEPDVRVPLSDALATAHLAALDRLIASSTDSSYRKTLQLTQNLVRARSKPVSIPATTLREYAGTYDQREVRFDGTRLWYYRDRNRAPEELIPVDSLHFGLGEAVFVEFLREGNRVVAMRISPPTGAPSTFPRTK